MMNLSVEIAGIKLKNPVTVASGTFGYGLDYADFYDPSKLGAIFLKTLTLKPREGHPPQRIVETPSGMLNAIGLQNIGVERFLKEKLPQLEKIDTVLIANIAGDKIEDYAKLAEKLTAAPKISAIEINVSCTNVKKGGMAFGASCETVGEVTRSVKNVSPLPVIVKLTPNVTNIVEIALAAEASGADAISLINTFLAMAIDIENQKPILSNVTGGLSGPAIKPIALRMVWQVASAIKIPVIGIGGIMTPDDAIEFFLAGASAIAVGCGNFVDPLAPIKIISGIESYLKQKKLTSVRQLIGALKT